MTDALVEIELVTLAYGGDALGRLPDGRAVFVPFSLPGEIVRARLVEQKRSHARAELVEVLLPSPERIEPRCPHYMQCGGCHYQHLSYPAQLAAKTAILKDQLERIGKLNTPNVLPAIPSPQPWNYRNYVQFQIASDGRLGYMASGSEQVLPIQECHLPEPPINTLWPQIDLEPLPGLARLGLRLGSDEDLQLMLESDDPGAPDFSADLDVSAVYLGPERSVLLSGSDHVTIKVLGRPFRVSAGSFFQVNTHMAETLVEHLLQYIAPSRANNVLDVYCGVGLFSAFLAEGAAHVTGIESSPYACYDFEANLDEFENVTLYEGEAEEILPHLDLQTDLAVVDPPRAGLARTVVDSLIRLAPRSLVYVSCDPATPSRDARRLSAGGYHLIQVTPFDLFPQTYHIESVSFWERAGGN